MSLLWEAMYFIHGAFSTMNYLMFESRADVEGIHVYLYVSLWKRIHIAYICEIQQNC